jgi:hypothetical protein
MSRVANCKMIKVNSKSARPSNHYPHLVQKVVGKEMGYCLSLCPDSANAHSHEPELHDEAPLVPIFWESLQRNI